MKRAPLRGGGLRSRSLAVTAGATRTQIDTLKEGCDVIIGTPGRVGWLVSEGYLETDDLQAVVMDECDVLLGDSFEFAEQVEPLKFACKPTTQFVLITAGGPSASLLTSRVSPKSSVFTNERQFETRFNSTF